jgi:hypothetical protein
MSCRPWKYYHSRIFQGYFFPYQYCGTTDPYILIIGREVVLESRPFIPNDTFHTHIYAHNHVSAQSQCFKSPVHELLAVLSHVLEPWSGFMSFLTLHLRHM